MSRKIREKEDTKNISIRLTRERFMEIKKMLLLDENNKTVQDYVSKLIEADLKKRGKLSI